MLVIPGQAAPIVSGQGTPQKLISLDPDCMGETVVVSPKLRRGIETLQVGGKVVPHKRGNGILKGTIETKNHGRS